MIEVTAPPLLKGQTVTYIHDFALDGDENMYIGKIVGLAFDNITAKVVQRDDIAKIWYLKVEDNDV